MTWAERSRTSTRAMRNGRASFSFEEVRRLGAEAVRTCDGFEFRYHKGGTVTWRETGSSHEIAVRVLVGVPVDGWRHLDGCACEGCRTSAAPRAPGRGTVKLSDVVV